MKTFAARGILLALTLAPSASHAQIAYDAPKARVEVLGLHHWTLKMLQDSVRHYVPGQELSDHACMITLRDSLHFPDAHVEYYFTETDHDSLHVFLSIKVVEPEDSGRVHWDLHPRDPSSSLLPDYAALVLGASDTAGVLNPARILEGVQAYQSIPSAPATMLAGAPPAALADARRVWAFMNAHRSESDRRRAMRVLETNGFYANRFVASIVLAGFSSNDSTWWALVRALRDPQAQVRQAARGVLDHLAPHTVDWGPALTDLRFILGGTNLAAIETIPAVLDETNVSPELASRLLHDNADWLLMTLASEHPTSRPAAHRLLVRLNRGVDLGGTRADWTRWAASL